MGNYHNLVGKKFGKLIVIEDIGRYSTNEVKWLCKCECGRTRVTKTYFLKKGVTCCTKCNYENYEGQTIGKLTILHRAEDKIDKNGNKVILWVCKCKCGEIVCRVSALLKRGNCCCKKCLTVMVKEINRKGYKGIYGMYWSAVKSNAKKRKIKFDITEEYAWSVLEKQTGVCAISGINLYFPSDKKEYLAGMMTASIDRIDSSLDYVEGNIQWVDKWVNIMKSDHDEKDFIEICHKISEFQRKNDKKTNQVTSSI